jgi:hypothetical protein
VHRFLLAAFAGLLAASLTAAAPAIAQSFADQLSETRGRPHLTA